MKKSPVVTTSMILKSKPLQRSIVAQMSAMIVVSRPPQRRVLTSMMLMPPQRIIATGLNEDNPDIDVSVAENGREEDPEVKVTAENGRDDD
jgi:hypothetical protein